MADPNSIEDFRDRFEALADEALSYGVASLSIVSESDPIGGGEKNYTIRRGGFAVAVGLAKMVLWDLEGQWTTESREL